MPLFGRNRVTGLSAVLCLTVLVFVVAGTSTPAFGRICDTVTYIITGDVYYGDSDSFTKPCVINRKKVFARIPAVKTIKSEKLDKNSPRYTFLIEQANKVFRNVVKTVAKKKGYDLVVERKGIKASDGSRITDLTRTVVKAVPKS